jgi:UDP-N-acetylmuramate: L-alanyl-gamma-D-glutamyl-meso-diaminopimelate ligase
MSEAKKKVHFIAIGESAMHNLAIALLHKGFEISGSDHEINEPSRSRLAKSGLVPSLGWNPSKINKDLEAVILGMHARADNPELLKARELGIKIFSYPEYIFQQSIDKQRIVISGSYGKTTITGMILHVLNYFHKKFDYMVGAQVEGFDTMVKLTDDAPIIIIEGDENLTSSLDPTSKFLKYHHHIGLVSGVAWDHINVFPTFDEYVKQFDAFADATPKGGTLIYCESEDLAALICKKERDDVQRAEYKSHKHEVENGETYLITDEGKIPVQLFGKHNMKNISGAKAVCNKIGISDGMFYEAIKSFKGAANRLETLEKGKKTSVFIDFAHTPSKLKASTTAVKKQFDERKLVAVLELHSLSSLNKEFLSHYHDTFKNADEPVVYYSTHSENKNGVAISEEDIRMAFNSPQLKVFTSIDLLRDFLMKSNWKNKNLLLMSSGNFGGLDIKDLAKKIVETELIQL